MTNAVAIAQYGSLSPNKNRIINGGMVIDQRNAGASVTPSSFTYTLDRWEAVQTTASKFSVQQNAGSVTPPTGFTKYLGVTSLSAYSVGSGDTFNLLQSIEGYNVADLGFGTANAQTVTLSFKVYSSLTGTFGGALKDNNSVRSYPFTYTVSSANTWTSISVTIPGDTTGSNWGTTNNIGMQVCFGLGGGSTYSGTAGTWNSTNSYTATGATSVVGTSGATFYITGVQLEAGTTASPFEYRQYGTELALCQRYFCTIGNSQYVPGKQNGTTDWLGTVCVPVSLRASPTVSFSAAPTLYLFGQVGIKSSSTNSVSLNLISGSNSCVGITLTGFSGLSDNYVANVRWDGANLLISAEL